MAFPHFCYLFDNYNTLLKCLGRRHTSSLGYSLPLKTGSREPQLSPLHLWGLLPQRVSCPGIGAPPRSLGWEVEPKEAPFGREEGDP